MEITEKKQKIEKKFFLFQRIEFEVGDANSRNIEQDTCCRHSVC